MLWYVIQIDMMDCGWIWYLWNAMLWLIWSMMNKSIFENRCMSGIWYELQAWYDMNYKQDMIWIVARYDSCTRLEDAWCIGPKKELSTDYSRHCTYNGTNWRSIERVSIPNLWLLNMLDRRSYETGQYPWTHAKGSYVGHIDD